MANFVWYLPLITSIWLAMTFVRLAKSGRKLQRQSNRLNTALEVFKNTDRSESSKLVVQESASLKTAELKRRQYLNKRTKAKNERQRRLVKRLRNLKSKESE